MKPNRRLKRAGHNPDAASRNVPRRGRPGAGDRPALDARPPAGPAAGSKAARGLDALIVLALAAGSFLLYVPSFSNDFVELDDPQYVTENPTVQRGLTWENVRWAFTTTHFGNWLPVTWLSHMLDCSMWGLNAGGHHATSAALHAANAAMVFLLFRGMTGARKRSAAVAALFAIHPLRVESVVWVAERKDVLAASFFLLTLLAYVAYSRKPSVGRYLPVLLFDALGLMSKTMLVTVPCLLLLLDFWPLRRFRRDLWANDSLPHDEAGDVWPRPADTHGVGRLVLEKLPLVALSIISGVWTVVLQRRGGAMRGGELLSLSDRLGNAAVSIPRYLVKTIRPTGLSPFYPHPGHWPAWQVAASILLILAITGAALLWVRRRPYFAVGWFWFLGMLVPVLGVMQVGLQAMADRYTYLTSIGLLLAAVWGIAEAARRRPGVRRALVPAGAAILAVLAVGTWLQQRYWASTLDLFEHALAVDERNWLAHGMVGLVDAARGDDAAAIKHYARAAELNPNHAAALHNYGRSLYRLGRVDEAIARYRQAARVDPTQPATRLGLGTALIAAKDFGAAATELAEAARLEPSNPEAYAQWGAALAGLGRRDEAAERFRQALQRDPGHPAAREGLSALTDPRRPPSPPRASKPAAAPAPRP